jgi:hypothetical protein
VENPDAVPGHAGRQIPGQLAEAVHQAREPPGRGPEPGHDLVGAIDDVVAHVAGIGAAAAGVLGGGQLRLDVALDRMLGQHRLSDRLEVVGVHIQPVEVTVAHDRRPAGLLLGPLEHGPEARQVAVEAANDVQVAGLQQRWLGECLRLVPVGQRAGASPSFHGFSRA